MDGVTVIICCHNSAGRLPLVLDHLRDQLPVCFPWEIVVVDNASTDNTAEVARANWPGSVPLRIIHEDAAGLAHARRRGIAEARYGYLSFVDDDNRVEPGWVRGVYNVFEAYPAAGALNGFNEVSCDGALPEWFDRFTVAYAVSPPDWSAGDVTDTRGWLWGAGLSIRRAAWNQITGAGWRWRLTGRQGEALSSGEDLELAVALRTAGWRLRYEPALRLKHHLDPHRLTWSYLRRLMRQVGAASVLHDLYTRPDDRWWLAAAASLKTAAGASLGGAALLAPAGSWRVLSMDRELGRAAALWRLRERHAQLAGELAQVRARLETLRPTVLVSR